MNKQSFGQYITKVREEKSIRQRGLAALSGLTNSTINRIEADTVKPDVATLEKLASALNIDKEILLSKCGYSEIPEKFVAIARRTGELTEEQRAKLYHVFDRTIDDFLNGLEDDEED